MNLYGRLIAAATLTLSAIPAMGAESLWDIYQLAQQRDPQIRAAAANRTAKLEVLPQARAGLLPDIGFNGSLDRRRFDDLLDNDKNINYSTDQFYTLKLTQPVFRFDRLVQLRQADSRILQSEAEYTAAQQELMIRTATRYFIVLGAKDNLEFARSEKSAISRQLDQATQRFDVGLTAITDVHEAQARYDLSVSEEIKAETLLENAFEAVSEITAEEHRDLQVLKSSLSLVAPEPESPNAWVETALKQNYTLIAAQAATETARREIQRQRSGHLPSLDLTADQSYRDLSFGGEVDQERYDGSIGLLLNIPIFKGGFVRSRTREARALFDVALEQAEQQRRATKRQMRNTYRGVIADISLVRALGQALVSTHAALEAAQAGFDVGTRTIVDVLNAQREVFRAKRDFARARYDYLLNTLRMKQSAGTLADGDIERISANLKPHQPVATTPINTNNILQQPLSRGPTKKDHIPAASIYYRKQEPGMPSISFTPPELYPYIIGPLS